MQAFAIAGVATGTLLTVLGLGRVVRSLPSASRRGQAAGGFWARAEMFLAHELADNRRGFRLCLAGLVVSASALYLLA